MQVLQNPFTYKMLRSTRVMLAKICKANDPGFYGSFSSIAFVSLNVIIARTSFSTSSTTSLAPGGTVNINFAEESSGNIIRVKAKLGQKIVDIAIEHDIDIEAACGGELACSTCHVVLPQKYFDALTPAVEEEEDMLDLAWGLTDRSRLCCQIIVTPELEGCTFTVPQETNNVKKL